MLLITADVNIGDVNVDNKFMVNGILVTMFFKSPPAGTNAQYISHIQIFMLV